MTDTPDERLRLSDATKLARRAKLRVIGVARAEDRVTFRTLIADQLGAALEELMDTRNAMTRTLLGGR